MNTYKYSILIVDDELQIIKSIMRILKNADYDFYFTDDPLQTVGILKSNLIDIIISDQRMPNMTGLELLKKAKEVSPSTVRILMSAFSDIDIVIAAVNEGKIYQYISKPWDNEKIVEIMKSAILYKKEEDENKKIVASTLGDKAKWYSMIEQLNWELERKKENTINALMKVLRAKDYNLYKHSERVSNTAVLLAELAGLTEEQKETVRYAGIFHDIGKIAIRDKIMYKNGTLDDREFSEMKNHPAVGAEILREADFLGVIADVVEQHHERVNGTGYPKGIRQNEILMEAQIISVADTFEALREDRVYRAGMTHEEALGIIQADKGIRYNPLITDLLEKAIRTGMISSIDE